MPPAGYTQELRRFDRWSRTYDGSLLQLFLFRRVHQAVLNLVAQRTEPKVLLDVGCGTGRLLRAARVRWPNAEFTGVDPSLGMIEMARRLTTGATFLNGFAENLPLADSSVDVVLSTISFHHWQDHGAGVREVARVLRPGGYFFLTDLVWPAWVSLFSNHHTAPPPARISLLFTEAGLHILMQQALTWHFTLVTVGQRTARESITPETG